MNGNRTSATDVANRTTPWAYDERNRLVQQVADGATPRWPTMPTATWKVTDAPGLVTEYKYNGFGGSALASGVTNSSPIPGLSAATAGAINSWTNLLVPTSLGGLRPGP